jgi:hypothetical protein
VAVDGFAFNERKDPLDPDQNDFFQKGPDRHFQHVRFQKKVHIVVGMKLMKIFLFF